MCSDLAVYRGDRVRILTWLWIATRHDGVIVSLAETPEAVAIEIVNSKSVFRAREEAAQNAARWVDENASDINLDFQRCTGILYLEEVCRPQHWFIVGATYPR